MSKLIRIAGIDPSLQNMGIALGYYDIETGDYSVDDLKLIKSQKTTEENISAAEDKLGRCRLIYRGLVQALESNGVRFVFVELPNGGSLSSSAAFAFGSVYGLLAGLHQPIFNVTPKNVQVAALGKSGADKESIRQWAYAKYPDIPWRLINRGGKKVRQKDNEHLADACAVIAAGVVHPKFLQTLALARGLF